MCSSSCARVSLTARGLPAQPDDRLSGRCELNERAAESLGAQGAQPRRSGRVSSQGRRDLSPAGRGSGGRAALDANDRDQRLKAREVLGVPRVELEPMSERHGRDHQVGHPASRGPPGLLHGSHDLGVRARCGSVEGDGSERRFDLLESELPPSCFDGIAASRGPAASSASEMALIPDSDGRACPTSSWSRSMITEVSSSAGIAQT